MRTRNNNTTTSSTTSRTRSRRAKSAPREGRDAMDASNQQERQNSKLFRKRAESGVHAARKGTVKAGQLVGKGTRGTVKFGARTGKGALLATTRVAKNTVKVGKGTVGVVGNLQHNAIDVAELTVKGVTNLTNLAARTLKRNEVAAAAAWKTRTTSRITKIELEFSCRNLRRKDAFAECDAFAVLWQVPSGYGSEVSIGRMGDDSFVTSGGAAGGNGSVSLASLMTADSKGHRRKRPRVPRLPTAAEKEIGRTEVVKGNKHPEFKHKFVIDFKFQEEQTYVIRVYDCDLEFCQDLKEHDFLGGTIFTMGELMGVVGKQTLRRPLHAIGNERNKSRLMIEGNEVSTTRSVLEFRFSAEELREKDNKVIDRQENLFFHVLKLNMEDQTWQPVYKSEVVMHNSCPTWQKARIPLPEICNDDIRNPIKITFWDWVREGQIEQLGYIETTVQFLIAEAERGIPVFDVWRDKPRAFARTKTWKQGKLKVLRAELKPVPTLLEYAAGGCNLNVTVAVDCSIYNDYDRGGGSLHDRPDPMWLNDYAAAINKIGRVMGPYCNDEFNIWGFGATLRGEETTLFPMGYADGTVKGASGLLDAYDTCFIENPQYMEPSDNTNIAPLIQSAMYRAIQDSESEHCYSVLCILTAGKIGEDLRETIDTVCTAAEDAPLSIVIIGVGDNQEDFEDIKLLLANGGKLRHSNGVPSSRNIVGFASFSDLEGSSERVVAEALKELPEQLVEYFTDNGIQPRPPLSKEEEMSSTSATMMKDHSKKSRNGGQGISASMKDSSRRNRNGRSNNKTSGSPKGGSTTARDRDTIDHRRRYR